VILANHVKASLIGYKTISDRLLYVQIRASPYNISLCQVYAPTSLAADTEMDDFYGQLQQEIDNVPSQDVLFITGDFNTKVGQKVQDNDVGGHYGLGCRNARGESLINFCDDNKLVITNTLFQHHKRKRYTWCSTNGVTRNQIDFILVTQRFRSCVTNSRAYPGADCGSDHNLVSTNVKLRIRKEGKKHPQEVVRRSRKTAGYCHQR